MVSRLNESTRPEFLRLRTTHVPFLDTGHGRMPRTLPQPGRQFVDRRCTTAGSDFDTPVRKVHRVASNAERQCHIPGTGAKENALYASADEKFTTHKAFDGMPSLALRIRGGLLLGRLERFDDF